MGANRLKTMYQVSKRITNFLADSDKEAALEARTKRIERAVIRRDNQETVDPEELAKVQADKAEMEEIQKRMAT